MLPSVMNPVWRDLVCGRKQIESGHVAVSMFLFNAKIKAREGVSELALAEDAYALFKRLEFCLKDEIQQLSELAQR